MNTQVPRSDHNGCCLTCRENINDCHGELVAIHRSLTSHIDDEHDDFGVIKGKLSILVPLVLGALLAALGAVFAALLK